MSDALSLAQVNTLSREDFVAQFGDIAEHSSWVAEGAEILRPFGNHSELVDAFQRVVLAASETTKDALISAHPDLAGRLALAKQLTADSANEQGSVGLDRLTPAELEKFTTLNNSSSVGI